MLPYLIVFNFTAKTHRFSDTTGTNGGKALMAYLRDLGVLVERRTTAKKSSYMRSKEDVRTGKVEAI